MAYVWKPTKQKRTVTLCHGVESARKGNGAVRLWAFSVRSLAELFGEHEWRVREWIRDKEFVPTDLTSVFEYAVRLKVERAKRSATSPVLSNVETTA